MGDDTCADHYAGNREELLPSRLSGLKSNKAGDAPRDFDERGPLGLPPRQTPIDQYD
jgi:hypothetical protein